MTHRNTSLQRVEIIYQLRKWLIMILNMISFFSDCTKSLRLEIKNQINFLDKLYIIVRTLNMNDDTEEKCFGVSTDFIRNFTGLFFIIIVEKAYTKIPLSKIYRFFFKCNTYISIWTHVLIVMSVLHLKKKR